MISQGYPLYASTGHASAPGAWVVVGWVPVGNSGGFRPIVAPVDREARNAIVPNDDLTWTFTADPREATPAGQTNVAARYHALHARLTRRLAEIEKTYDADARWAAAQIRKELSE